MQSPSEAPSTLSATGSQRSPLDGARDQRIRGAYWVMVRRVTVVAGLVDLAFLALFLLLDSPLLAWINLLSLLIYALAWWLLGRRINSPALVLIWTEVLGHAALGSLLLGWDSGFHYYLLMFIPAIVVGGGRRSTVPLLLLLLLLSYLGLHTLSCAVGALAPLEPLGLALVHGFNVVIVFAMAAYTAQFYNANVRRAERRLIELATRDPLTGLCNRRNLVTLAGHEIARARRSGEPIALVMADIDRFKSINDRYGHEAGDQVILSASALLTRLCRGQDIVARWGGEEFLLLLPNTRLDAAGRLAERIRQALAETEVSIAGDALAVTISLGVTDWSTDEDLNAAIGRADRALYQSKRSGRDQVTVVAAAG